MTIERDDPLHVALLARFYRESGQPEESVHIFRNAFDKLPLPSRSSQYYHEWGTAERAVKNFSISAWLEGIALADDTPIAKRVDNYSDDERGKIGLSGLAADFEELSPENPLFARAWGAATQLGLTLQRSSKTSQTHHRLQQSRNRYREAGIDDVNPLAALDQLIAGIVAAWQGREAELSEEVRKPDELTFKHLADLLKIRSK